MALPCAAWLGLICVIFGIKRLPVVDPVGGIMLVAAPTFADLIALALAVCVVVA